MSDPRFAPSRVLGFLAGVCALVLAALPADVAAQQGGNIVGTVTEQQTGRPLEAAQIYIPGTAIGTLTNASGRFLLINVPFGEVEVRAELVGYRAQNETVTVSPGGESTVIDFQLPQTAIQLDQIVVTGAGVATEKRRLGNTIATIDASSLEDAPIATFSELIQGRDPGLVGLPSSGTTGEGSRIRIRGSASLSQSNEPIVYVDGVRIDNSGGFAGTVGAGGQGTASRLDDIDPNTIERVEVLKGAAAATLYGTEASSGVIQIFTKRGSQGAPRWTFQIEQSAISTPTDRMIPVADFPRDADQVASMQQRFGVSLQPFEVYEHDLLPELVTTGWNQTYSGSVSGGSDLITYFVSGRYAHEDGPFEQEFLSSQLEENGFDGAVDENQKIQATANLNVFPLDNLSVKFTSLYSEVSQKTPDNSNNIYGVFSSALMSQLRLATEDNYYGQPAFATLKENMNQYVEDESNHFNGSINANLQVTDAVTFDGTFGLDLVNQRSSDFRPFRWNLDNYSTDEVLGSRQIAVREHRELTGNLNASWNTMFGERVSSTLLGGFQGFLSQTTESGGEGDNFPGPGIEVAEAGSVQTLDEEWLRVVNAGVYLQEQIGWDDYVFLTLGGRWDANSAFGENFETAFYPKASISFIPTDAFDWDNPTLSTFRLRAAVGESGLQPGAFDKFTTFSPLASSEGPGLQPENLGNQNLKPEVAREWELGSEIGLFEDRAALDVTYWNRTVSDALVARQFPVSGGFRATQLDNIGEVKAWGVEVATNGSVIQRSRFSLNLFASASYIEEEITDMGGAPPLKTGGSYPRYVNYLREGYTPGAFFGAKLADLQFPFDLNGDCTEPTQQQVLDYFSQARNPSDFEVIPVNCARGAAGTPDDPGFLDSYLGKPTPDWQGSVGFNLDFLDNFQLSSLFEFKYGDFFVQDLSGGFRQANSVIGRNTPAAARVTSIMMNPASTAEQRLEAAQIWARELRALAPMSGMNMVRPADFLRWRELSLSYRVPATFVERLGANSATVSFGVRNLKLWMNDEYSGMDPEINILGRCNEGLDCNFLNSVEGWGLPIPRRFTFALRTTF